MRNIISFRNFIFKEAGKKFYTRIIFYTILILIIWKLVEYFNEIPVSFNIMHDIKCLCLAILLELLLPWGKQKDELNL